MLVLRTTERALETSFLAAAAGKCGVSKDVLLGPNPGRI
jgi:hypothetical protein